MMMKEGMREKAEVPKEDSERGAGVWEGQGRMVTSKAARECKVSGSPFHWSLCEGWEEWLILSIRLSEAFPSILA